MPRGPRLDAPGIVHHVMARGIERRVIFRDDVDRGAFVTRLDDLVCETETPLYAWCLLPNHFHLLLRSGAASLSTLMRRLLTAYAVRFNRRHRRAGHLMQNRFKSIVVEEEAYLLELVRYIHLNALRAGVVTDFDALERYEWAGHGAMLGRRALQGHDVDFVLGQFGRTRRAAREAYREFVRAGIAKGRRPELTGGGLQRSLQGWRAVGALERGRERWTSDERILGSSEFVLRTLRDLPDVSAPRAGRLGGLENVLALVASRRGVGVAEIRSNSHRPAAVAARALVVSIAIRTYGLTPTAVAAQLGVSRRSVARAFERAQQFQNTDPDLADLLQSL